MCLVATVVKWGVAPVCKVTKYINASRGGWL